MKFLFGFVACFLCCSGTLAGKETYRSAIIGPSTVDEDFLKYVPVIHEAGKSNADIIVLPLPKSFSSLSTIENSLEVDNYDELVHALSEAAKQAGLYVVAHLLEKTICQSKYELIRSNLVFGRDGNIVSVYRKPLNNVANCTTPPTDLVTFTTDFGIEFGLLMEEDLVLLGVDRLNGLKNFVVAGAWSSDMPFLRASQFASSWAFTNKVTLVSSAGVFQGSHGAKTSSEAGLFVVDLKKSGGNGQSIIPPVVSSPKLETYPEDLSQHIIKPLDTAASAKGYMDTVCHDDFCCEFFIKTRLVGPKKEDVSYGLAAFNGIRSYGKHNIGTQTCAVFACTGLCKRTYAFGSNSNGTNLIFEKISIHSNSTRGTSQYPIVLTTSSHLNGNQFHFNTKDFENQKQVKLESSNIENVLSFGIFGRDFTKDTEGDFVFEEELSFKDEMQELFDYLWIRIRVLIFVVSIYFLEMM